MVVKTKSQPARWWAQSRRDAGLTAGVLIVLAYILTSRALDTGSLGQYGIVVVLVVLFLNRLIQVVKPGKE